jgi:cytochrome P450
MTLSREAVTVDFDHHRPAQEIEPDDAVADLRERCPVAWTEAHGGYWVVTKYDDVSRVMKDFRSFSSTSGVTIPPVPFGENGLLDMDPPRHTRYRRALNPTLTKQVVETQVRARLEHWTDIFIDRVIEDGRCDLMYDIAVPIPAAVTLEWLGWDSRHEWWRIAEAWHDIFGRPVEDPRWERANEAVVWFSERIAEELERRRAEPKDDPLTLIALLEEDGELIPLQQAVSLARLLVAGGIDTTTSVIGSALVYLHSHPDLRERLAAEPELWPTAVEDFVRRYTPARNPARLCVHEVEVGSCKFEPGDWVLPSLASANQDADAFDRPLEVTPERSLNKHVGFGTGVHRCIGQHLARAEFIHVVSTVLARMPDYQVLEEELVAYSRQSEAAGWMKAPATFTPGTKLTADSDDVLLALEL